MTKVNLPPHLASTRRCPRVYVASGHATWLLHQQGRHCFSLKGIHDPVNFDWLYSLTLSVSPVVEAKESLVAPFKAEAPDLVVT